MISARTLLVGLLALLAPKRAHSAQPQAQRVGTLDAVVMLDAIAAVETGDKYWPIGKAGERGRCQFMPATWARYTNADFATWASRDCDLTRRVERAHLAHLMRALFRPGHIPEPALIAAGWRYGEGRAGRNVRSDYAKRVANLYWDAIGRKGTR
jgi:hypothetical protein